jgi:hypothetical protein
MDINKIIGISSKAIMAVLIIVGLVMCYNVLADGNPKGWSEQDKYDQGQIIVAANGGQNELSPEALEKKINEEGKKVQETTLTRQTANVESTLGFTKWIVIFALILIAAALVLAIVLSPKKFIVAGVGVIVFGIILYVIYSGAESEVPAMLTMNEADKFTQSSDPDNFEYVYTPDNWKMAGAAVTASLFLIGTAVVGIVVSSIVKLVK